MIYVGPGQDRPLLHGRIAEQQRPGLGLPGKRPRVVPPGSPDVVTGGAGRGGAARHAEKGVGHPWHGSRAAPRGKTCLNEM